MTSENEARAATPEKNDGSLFLPAGQAAAELTGDFQLNRADATPEDFWRSLNYFNLYRLALVCFIVFIALAIDVRRLFGEEKGSLFLLAAWLYVLVVLLSFIPLRMRGLKFTWQMAIFVCSDIFALTFLAHASGGIQSSVGLLLMVSMAVAGIISRGRITLFFAALASISALLEHTFSVLYDDAPVAQYIQAGLLCVSYFAVAWLAHKLAQYALENQKLAQRRGHDLLGMAEANRLVMRDMQDGVLVIDEHDCILQMNPSAFRLLETAEASGQALAQCFPLLYARYAQWKISSVNDPATLKLDGGLQARLRFVGMERDLAQGGVIFLEDMQQVQAEAQQIKLAALGRLTANLAHEVRNPLSAISYATELLQEEPADATQARLLQLIRDNTQRINRIIQDVMQLNRRDRAQRELFDLALFLNALAVDFLPAERVESGVLILQADPGRLIRFDRGHLRQVLWNLCRNGLHFGRRMQGSLALRVSVDRGRVVLDVQDDGPGISPSYQSRLFEPFFTTADQGTGLGLYIARELCEANGAWLEYHLAHSVQNAGACFRITFGECRAVDGSEQE